MKLLVSPPTQNITSDHLIRTRMSQAGEELCKHGTQVAQPPHPLLTQMTATGGNAESSHSPPSLRSPNLPPPLLQAEGRE